MSSQAADFVLLRRLNQIETDLDGMCKELHRRRGGSHASPAGQSNTSLRRRSPRQGGLTRSSSQGDRRRPHKSASTASLQHYEQKLSAVLESSTASTRRIGASREDCNEAPTYASKPRCTVETPRASPMLAKSQSTTTAGLGSSSSGSCAALTISSATPRLVASLMKHESASMSDASSDRCTSSRQEPRLLRSARSPRSLANSLSKSAGAVERIDLNDSTCDASQAADAKRDLVWQLELERLRNATLKLEVQREICEGSDLRKRLLQTEAQKHTASSTMLLPTTPIATTVTTTSIPALSSVPSVKRLSSVTKRSLAPSYSQVVPSISTTSISTAPPAVEVEASGVASATSARLIVPSLNIPKISSAAVEASVPATSQPLMRFSPRHRIGSLHAPIATPRLK